MPSLSDATSTSVTRRPNGTVARWILVALESLVAVSAVVPGVALALRNDGSLIRLPMRILRGTPFLDFTVPGTVLAVLVAGSSLLAAIVTARRRPHAWLASVGAGFTLAAWFAVQVAVIGWVHALQVVYLSIAAAIVALALSMRPDDSIARATRAAVRDHALGFYFAIVFASVWLHSLASIAVNAHHLAPLPSATRSLLTWIALLGGPLGASAFVIALGEGRIALKAWRAAMVRRDVPTRYYVVALAGYPALAATSLGMASLFRGTPLHLRVLVRARVEEMALGLGLESVAPWIAALALLAYAIVLVPLYEEPGWRGFALPRLARSLGPFGAAAVLGAVWAVWHLPSFFLTGTPHDGMPFFGFLAELTSLSVVMAWLYFSTGGSVLITMLMHASVIVGSIFFPAGVPGVTGDYLAFWLSVAGALAAGFVVVARSGAALGASPRADLS